jgi:hypothetical protein
VVQIIGRAHRYGQERTVHVYKLLAVGTTDVIMASLAKDKDVMLQALVTKTYTMSPGTSISQLHLSASSGTTCIDLDNMFEGNTGEESDPEAEQVECNEGKEMGRGGAKAKAKVKEKERNGTFKWLTAVFIC